MGGDQGGADARVETNLFIDGFCIPLEGAGVSSLGLAKHRADQAIKHIDGPIGQTGGNVQTNGDQRCVSPAAFVTSDMLGGGAPGFARKLGEPRLMDQVATAWFDANLTDVFQTLDQTEHRGWFGGFWHLLPRGAADRLTRRQPSRAQRCPAYATGHGAMAVLSLREAAEQAGTSKSTIWRAIRSGRLSATRTDDGGFAIDPAELFRAFPAERPLEYTKGRDATASTSMTERPATDEMALRLAAFDAEVKGLKDLLAEVKANREELRQDRDEWRGRAERLLTDRRGPWWRRLTR